MKIPLDQLSFSINVRTDFSEREILKLAENLRLVGLIHGITVVKIKDGYEVIAGKRRVLAARQLGWQAIEANVIADKSKGELIALSVSENLHRANMSPLDIADAAFYYCETENKTLREAAVLLGRSASILSRCQNAAVQLSEGTKQMLEGQSMSAHFLIAKVPASEQLELANEYITEKWTRKQLEERVNQKIKKPNGNSISLKITAMPNYESLIDCLTRTLNKIKSLQKQGVQPEHLSKILAE